MGVDNLLLLLDLGLSLGELGLGSLELLSLSLPDVLSLLGLLSLVERGGRGGSTLGPDVGSIVSDKHGSWSPGNGDAGRGGSTESDHFVVVEW